MAKFLIVGADVHEEYVMTKWCVDQGEASKSSFRMTESGQSKMIAMLHKTGRLCAIDSVCLNSVPVSKPEYVWS